MRCHTKERYSAQSWVDKYRTGSGSDRVEHSAPLGLAKFFTPLAVLGWVMTRSLPLPVLILCKISASETT